MKDRIQKIILFAVGVCILAVAVYGVISLLRPTLEFMSIQQKITAESFAQGIAPLKAKLDYKAWDHYTQIDHDTALNETLCKSLQGAKNPEEFAEKFRENVEEHYWSGYQLHLNNQTQLWGLRGTLTLHGEKIPSVAYGIVKTFDANNAPLETIIVELHQGTGFYNLFENSQNTPIYKTEIYVAADAEGKEPITAVSTQAVYPVEIPEIFISEVSNQHTSTYYPDSENKQHRGTQEQKFQYIELYNYSNHAVDLSELTLLYNDQLGQHKFEMITETAGSTVIEPKSVYVIGVYAADSALAGYKYDSDAGLSQYWAEFNKFYNTEIGITDRTLIACVKSGDATALLDGIDRLNTSTTADMTVSVQINRGNECITTALLESEMPHNSYAYQFLPAAKGTDEEEFLFSTGCFPGVLLKEQELTFCETPVPVDADIIKAFSYNILATDKNPAKKQGPVQYRSELFFRFMEEYRPDTIGLQEVNFRWVPLLQEKMKELGYGEVQGISGKNHTYENINTKNEWDLLNPIYYKLDRYELLDSGEAFLTTDGTFEAKQWDSINLMRSMTWAVLKDKESGDVITHVNTHLVLSGKQARVEQVKALYNKGLEMQKKYGGSIIITGDHNMAEGSEPYQAYINGGAVVDSKYQTTNHNSVSTYTDFDTAYNERYGAPIDFCFISPELKVGKYEVFGGRYSDGTISDHSAVLTELYLQK